MNLNAGWTGLNDALKTARVHWEAVQSTWDDAVRDDFEKEFWQPLEAQITSVLRAMERLSPVLSKVEQECQ